MTVEIRVIVHNPAGRYGPMRHFPQLVPINPAGTDSWIYC
jgi:hypothetical protein